jgi:hypothetical protein
MTDCRPLIDIGTALDLLTAVVSLRGARCADGAVSAGPPSSASGWYAYRGAPDCIVGHVFALVGVGVEQLEGLGTGPIRQLHAEGRLPVRLTLGALAVLDVAQRRQGRDYAWTDALADAMTVARRYVELIPDTVLSGACAQGAAGRPCLVRATHAGRREHDARRHEEPRGSGDEG